MRVKNAILVSLFALLVAGCGAAPAATSSAITSPAPAQTQAQAATTPAAPVATTPAAVVRHAAPTTKPAAPHRPARVRKAPVRVVAVHTRSAAPKPVSCGADYYRNSSGHCVHRPTAGPKAPAGATARCVDGTYSFSEHHSGTCSHHGGVAVWL